MAVLPLHVGCDCWLALQLSTACSGPCKMLQKQGLLLSEELWHVNHL